MSSFFDGVALAPPIEVYALTSSYNVDTSDRKVNLGVGG